MDWFRKRTIGQLPADAARRFPDRLALVFEEQRWTWREFNAEVDRVAKALIGIGVKPGDHVAVWMTNRPEWLFLMYAIPRVGAVLVPLNTRYRVDDIAYTVDQSDSSVLFAIDRSGPIDYQSMLKQNVRSLAKLKSVVLLGDSRADYASSWETFLESGKAIGGEELSARAAAVDPDALAVIIYTSGTTSAPKGVMHSHVALRLVAERSLILGVSQEDVFLSYLPLFHTYGFSENAIVSALAGGCQILTETFDAERILDLAERHGATVLHGFVTHYSDLIRAQTARPRNLKLRVGTFCAGEPSVAPVAYAAQGCICPTVSGWGLSEIWSFATLSHPCHTVEQRCEASGYPLLDVEVRIVDASGSDGAIGTAGEILVRSYTNMQGYYKQPEQTAQVMDGEGWIHTGDMGRLRPDGHLVFLGRYKDMLKVGGENVAPSEIEMRLSEVEGVQEVAVVGLPDERLGEVPIAYIVLRPGHKLSSDRLLEHLIGRVASFKIPRYIQFVEALPRTPTGKVRKFELRDRALTEFEQHRSGDGSMRVNPASVGSRNARA